MEEKQFLEILVKRYIANELSQNELDAFFYLLGQGKLDTILNKHLDKEKESELNGHVIAFPKGRLLGRVGKSLSIAASIILVLGMAFYTVRHNPFGIFDTRDMVTVRTGKGENKAVRLPDGSTVWLNESSSMEYPGQFDSHLRKVVLLEGEAYFDIKRDETKPFNVEAAGTTTKVLGTAFNIRSYRFLQSVQVTVTRGKVEVEEATTDAGKPQRNILLPNEQVYFNTKTKQVKKVAVNSANAVAWKEGKLLFDNESFGNVTAILENKFDVKISFADESIKNYHMSAEFVSTDTLPHILDLLSLANNLDYRLEKNQITLSRKKRNNVNQVPM